MTQNDTKKTPILIAKILFLSILPLMVLKFLKTNRTTLTLKDNQNKYGSLYHRQRVDSRFIDPIWTTPIFLGRRLVIAFSTIVFQPMPVLQLATSIYVTIFSMSFNLRVRPMDSFQMNMIEAMNDTIFLLSCYNMFVFTDFVPDVNTRYDYSKFVFHALINTLGFQMALVLLEIALIGIRKYRLIK